MSKKTSAKKARPTPSKKPESESSVSEIHSPEPSTLSGTTFSAEPPRNGRNWRSAGQSGDVQALSRKATVDSESVEELVEEGQTLEAAAISGVEEALDPDQAEVHTREVPEDDIPGEYIDKD